MSYELTINGEKRLIQAAPGTPLLWVIRDELGLTGTKFGCGVSSCGACTVHIDGNSIRSCTYPAELAVGKQVTTIEGLDDPVARAVQAAWVEKEVVQCGYCQSGQIMSAISLLKSNKNPSDKQIDSFMSGNACRCATYIRIKNAIKLAASQLGA